MISNDPKFNLGQLYAYKLMFAIKLSMEKRIKFFWAASGFSVFTRDKCNCLQYVFLQLRSPKINFEILQHTQTIIILHNTFRPTSYYTYMFMLLHSKIHHGKKGQRTCLLVCISIPDTSVSVNSVFKLEGAEFIYRSCPIIIRS